jgi:hypothetical protein
LKIQKEKEKHLIVNLIFFEMNIKIKIGVVAIGILLSIAMAGKIFGETGNGNNNYGSNPGGTIDVYVKATLPSGGYAEIITATVTMYRGIIVVAKKEISNGSCEYNPVTNTFNFYPVEFEGNIAATHAEVCVRGFHTFTPDGSKVWYTGGQTFTILPFTRVYDVPVQIPEGQYNCPGDPIISTQIPTTTE